jgi:uncharacterized protein YdeI (YjbR/CyaY-like superfamily)
MKNEDGIVFIESTQDLRSWLTRNHTSADSYWLVTWKRDSGGPYVNYNDVVDQLICFGWIDSLPRKFDDKRTMLRISQRNPKSNWSKVNKERVLRLEKAGLMEASGLSAVEEARKNGTWNFLDDVENLEIPHDLNLEFNKYPNSRYLFNRFPASSKRGILEWIKNAKTDATRRKRIEETAAKAMKNIKANHPIGRNAGPK